MYLGPDNWQSPRPLPAGIKPSEQLWLWACRRLALAAPPGAGRCHAVHALLQRQCGDAGLGAEHALGCVLLVLARRAVADVRFGEPCCPMLLADELRLLLALRLTRRDPAAAEAALLPLVDAGAAATLVPLLGFLAGLALQSGGDCD